MPVVAVEEVRYETQFRPGKRRKGSATIVVGETRKNVRIVVSHIRIVVVSPKNRRRHCKHRHRSTFLALIDY